MDQNKSGNAGSCLPVSLSLGDEFLGWYRAIDISMEGIRVCGPVKSLAQSSTLTVCFELKTEDAIVTPVFKALLVNQETNSVDLEWVMPDANLFRVASESEGP